MNLHEHYLRSSKAPGEILLKELILKDQVDVKTECSNLKRGIYDKDQLTLLKTVLCIEYQESLQKQCSLGQGVLFNFGVETIKEIFHRGDVRSLGQEFYILCDIVVLQTALHTPVTTFIDVFTNYQSYTEISMNKSRHDRLVSMKIIECFLDALYLKVNYLKYELTEDSFVKELKTLCLKVVERWLKAKQNDDWTCFAVLLPKIFKSFSLESDLLYELWNLIIEKADLSEDDKLSALCVIVEIFFRENKFMSSMALDKLHHLSVERQFWSFILKQSFSNDALKRKKTMYILRVVLSFTKEHKGKIMAIPVSERSEDMPFLCNNSKLDVEEAERNFFVILESLEEKQTHLVIPVLKIIESLVDAVLSHKQCGDCFSVKWLRCAIARIIQYENFAIVKWALLKLAVICDSIPDIANDEHFLSLLSQVLNNNISLHEQSTSNESCTTEIDQIRAQSFNENFENFIVYLLKENLAGAFIKEMAKINWAAVSINNVVYLLYKGSLKFSEVKGVNFEMTNEDLEIIKVLLETNLSQHSPILRIASQKFILSYITNSRMESVDLKLLANILLICSKDDSLRAKPFHASKDLNNWLRKVTNPSLSVSFILDYCDNIAKKTLSNLNLSVKSFALMTADLNNAGMIFQDQQCPAMLALLELFRDVKNAYKRPYIDSQRCLEIIELANCVYTFSDLRRLPITGTLTNVLMDAFKYTYQYAKESKSIENIETLLSVFSLMSSLEPYEKTTSSDLVQSLVEFKNFWSEKLMQDNSNNKLALLFGLSALHYCESFCQNSDRRTVPSEQMMNLIGKTLTMDKDLSARGCDRVIENECSLMTLKYISTYALHSHQWETLLNKWLDFANATLCLGNLEAIPFIIHCLEQILSCASDLKGNFDSEKIFDIVESCQSCIRDSKKIDLYWKALDRFTSFVISEDFLRFFKNEDYISKYAEELMTEDSLVIRYKSFFLRAIESIKPDCLHAFDQAINLLDKVLFCMIDSNLKAKDRKIEVQAEWSAINNDLIQPILSNYMLTSYKSDIFETQIRARAVMLMLKISCAGSEHCLEYLMSRIGKVGTRYFDDSHAHKTKSRIYQGFLLLQPILSQEDTHKLYDFLYQSLLVSSDQESIKLMQVWLIVRIYLGYPLIRHRIWEMLDEGIQERPAIAALAISIAYHVSVQLMISHDSRSESFVHRVLECLSVFSMGQQFKMRLYAQVLYLKIIDQIKNLKVPINIDQYKGFYSTVEKSIHSGYLSKNAISLSEHFFFTKFDPTKNYTIETLFHELLRLGGLTKDEFISASVFEELNFVVLLNHPLQLKDPESNQLSKIPLADSNSKMFSGDNILSSDESLKDAQKKMMPWKSINPVSEDRLDQARSSEIRERNYGIIVVASLVDRIPNLGGLARSCEIFGAKELVISNHHWLKEKEFKNLSVTAENWITITEVKVEDLKRYLLEQKRSGWSVLAAEQTINSQNLLDVHFPKNTILVLGNEKNGIPPNLVALMDKCVEIPQIGVLRSLNVHVTGAICLWQYAKQHNFIEKSDI